MLHFSDALTDELHSCGGWMHCIVIQDVTEIVISAHHSHWHSWREISVQFSSVQWQYLYLTQV